MSEANYLANLPTETLNEHGLTKTLLTRRETIYLKHILKNIFVYGDEESLNKKLEMLQFNQFTYFSYITNKLRGIYKLPRCYEVENAEKFVRLKRDQLIEMLNTYATLKPLIVLDFDKTITNTHFHALYQYLSDNFSIYINSANPDRDVIERYLEKHNLKRPKYIYANKGKKKKITRLKDIASKNYERIIFYIDDEVEYLDYGCMLGMYCYKYTKDGKAMNHTFFLK